MHVAVSPKQAAKHFGVTKETLRQWEIQGSIQSKTTDGGHRRYLLESTDGVEANEKRNFIYARVSSSKQKNDLERQIAALKKTFPNHEVISDVGSGINFKRKGLLTILELLFDRNVGEVVVAHRDRLARFGFDLFKFMFAKHGAILTVLEDSNIEKEDSIESLSKDLLSIITVFTARYYGARRYRNGFAARKSRIEVRKKSKNLSKQLPDTAV